MEAVGFWPGGRAMRTSAFRFGTPNGMILLPASKPRSVFVLPSQFDPESVNTLRRVLSGWSAIRKLSCHRQSEVASYLPENGVHSIG